jgi:hypothetical protein
MSCERLLIAAALLSACSGAPPATPPAPAPSASATAEPAALPEKGAGAEPEKPFTQIPTECDKPGDKLCVPPIAFAKRLCAGFYPDVALAMFAKGSPWTRGYLRREVEAWNASGGASSSDKLKFEEEVLLVVHRQADAGGMTVSGAGGSYDVLRWDGNCASLMDEEVTTKPPSAPKYAKIPWKSLGEPLREALLGSEKIGKIAAERKKECKGVTIGDVSAKCVKAETMLNSSIIDYVRTGGSLPAPSKMP